MSAASLKGFGVQGLALAGQADSCDLGVGEEHAGYGGCEQHHGKREAVDVVDENALTGELEQRGVVTERICDQSPASV